MPPSPATLARLATVDETVVRQRGPAGDALRRSLLEGSRIAIISPGYEGKRFIYERMRGYGVELVLVGEHDSWARALVEEGIAARYVTVDQDGDPDRWATAVVAALADTRDTIDGVVTIWEDAVPTTARVAAALGLPGSSPAAADAARSKERTLATSRAAGLPTPRYARLHDASDLEPAAADVGFPAVIKPIFGAEADGVIRVDDLDGSRAAYARVSRLIRPEHNVVYEQGVDLLLEEYLDGTEFDVDIVLADGSCVFAGVSENWPTHEPYFVETGLHSPSSHPPARLAAVVDLCVDTALALGFRDAVLHTEAKDTSRGPRLLEVNGRLGGGRIADYHQMVMGVDLVEQVLLLAVGLPVAPDPYPEPACGIANVVVQSWCSGVLRHDRFVDHLADDPTVFDAHVTADAGEMVIGYLDGFPTAVADLSVSAPDAATARALAEKVMSELQIPCS